MPAFKWKLLKSIFPLFGGFIGGGLGCRMILVIIAVSAAGVSWVTDTLTCGPDVSLVGDVTVNFYCFFVVLWLGEDDKEVDFEMEDTENLELSDQVTR